MSAAPRTRPRRADPKAAAERGPRHPRNTPKRAACAEAPARRIRPRRAGRPRAASRRLRRRLARSTGASPDDRVQAIFFGRPLVVEREIERSRPPTPPALRCSKCCSSTTFARAPHARRWRSLAASPRAFASAATQLGRTARRAPSARRTSQTRGARRAPSRVRADRRRSRRARRAERAPVARFAGGSNCHGL